MLTQTTLLTKHYTAAQQGSGAFDGGKITEIKPIDFPGGTSKQQRVGPLFYWAWASAKGDGVIGMHPHKGFEILSYVLEGEIGHSDTKGNSSRVGAGGAQLMQTGSGISHQEEMFGTKTEFFQIWFEPELQPAMRRPPVYADFGAEDFPLETSDGVSVKKIIGSGGAVDLVAPVQMRDISVDAGHTYRFELEAGQALAAMTVSGKGYWSGVDDDDKIKVESRDFVLSEARETTPVVLRAHDAAALRVVLVETPLEVDYPLYRF
jgi:quercetin 2,3-dioxygenase